MNETNLNSKERSDLKGAYKTFVRQMADWYNGGELPELAGQDLRFVLELQRQKLRSLGLDLKYEIQNKGSAVSISQAFLSATEYLQTPSSTDIWI